MNKFPTKKIACGAGIAVGVPLLYFVLFYFFVFMPSFGRMEPDADGKVVEHYGGIENFQRNQEDSEWFLAKVPIRLEMQSYDGLKLVAFFLPAEDAKGTILLMHGYHSSPLRDFATLARFYNGLGYHVCIPYQRTHGESEGKFLTFGIKERFDCRDWILKIDDMFEGSLPIFVEGISNGCATAVMASGFENLPLNLRGFIADCGFTEPREAIYYELTQSYHLPASIARLLIATGNLYTKIFAGFSLDDYTTFDALKINRRPMLFIHGSADQRVPVSMTMANYECCSFPKELFLAEGAIHAMAHLQQEEKYNKRVREFLERYGAK